MLEYLRQLEREWFGRGGSKNGSAAVHGWCRRQCAPSPKHAPTRLPPARPPEALAELLCRKRRRRSNDRKLRGRAPAAAMFAIAPSIPPPRVCSRQGRRRPSPSFCAAGTGGVATAENYGARRDNARHRPKHAPTRLPPAGPPKALAEFLCRRRRRRSNG